MNPEQDKNDHKRNFDAKVAELKADIERLLEPQAQLGSGALIVALLELGMERHLARFPDEKAARALLTGVLDKVLQRRSS
jgi:hypothetical protein